jgi:DNA segregation ATPase FtsK/SpoIIIE, S-DNA-T family
MSVLPRYPVRRWPLLADIVLILALVVLASVAVGVALVATTVGWLVLRHPFVLVAAAATGWTWQLGGPAAVGGMWAGIAVAAHIWRTRHRVSFDRVLLSRFRRTFVYGWRWRRAMAACHLDRPGRPLPAVPRLGPVRSTRWADVIFVRPRPDQDPGDFAARSRRLADALGVLDCEVHVDAAGGVCLVLRRGDPLDRLVPALPVADIPDLDALALGVREDGRPWTVRLAHGHLLVAGPACSGRTTVVWALLRALAGAAAAGSVEVWGISGRDGLQPAAGLFSRFALDGEPAAALAILDDAAERRRAGPPVVLVVDDPAEWAARLDDDARRRADRALERVLARGEATGVVVVATADARPPRVAARFPQWVVLRGTAAGRHRPGVGLATTPDGTTVRVRAAAVSEDEMAAVARRFRVDDGSALVAYAS